MIRLSKIAAIVIIALLLQVTIFPARLLDPFQPNMLIILVVYLGLRGDTRLGAPAAFLLGLLQDSVSGVYLGLSGFSYLSVYILLEKISDRLYTDNRYLIILMVFLATFVSGLLNLLLLLVFSASRGIYASMLPALVPQALVNALIASLLFGYSPVPGEEAK
jgi:rod shape-determining protein MreD